MAANLDRKIKALVILDGSLFAPSAMVSGYQYKDLFEEDANFSVQYVSYSNYSTGQTKTGHEYLEKIKQTRPYLKYAEYRTDRHREHVIELASQMDLVYIVKVPHIELYRELKRLNKPKILTAYSDGLWLPFFQTWWSDFDEMLSLSDGIVSDNHYTLDYASKRCAKVFIVNDSPQVEVFDIWRPRVTRDTEVLTIGWIGSSETASNLYKIFEPLEELFARYEQLHLRIVGAEDRFLPRFEKVRWSSIPKYNQEIMAQEILKMDIGIFPLYKVEESLARGILKATVYMSGEACTVCQDFGVAQQLIRDGENGLLADTPEEWVTKLDWLITNPQQRKLIASNGLSTIRQTFTKRNCFEQLHHAMVSVCQ